MAFPEQATLGDLADAVSEFVEGADADTLHRIAERIDHLSFHVRLDMSGAADFSRSAELMIGHLERFSDAVDRGESSSDRLMNLAARAKDRVGSLQRQTEAAKRFEQIGRQLETGTDDFLMDGDGWSNA
jgi:hypothetical protein